MAPVDPAKRRSDHEEEEAPSPDPDLDADERALERAELTLPDGRRLLLYRRPAE